MCRCTHVVRVGSSRCTVGSTYPWVVFETLHHWSDGSVVESDTNCWGTQDACVKLRILSADPVTVELVGYSDRDSAGDPSSRKSPSSGHVEADGCPLTSFSRRHSCVATSFGMAVYYSTGNTFERFRGVFGIN